MSYLNRGLWFIILFSWSFLCNGIDVCTKNTSVSPCCPCPNGRLCNATCPTGFEEVENTGQECIVETTHVQNETAMAANDTDGIEMEKQTDINEITTSSSTTKTNSGHCRRCPTGFYVDDDNVTHCCHPACRTCTGRGDANCIACMIEFGHTCVATCPSGHREVEASEVHSTTTSIGANEPTETTDSSAISNDSVTPSTEDVEGILRSTSSSLVDVFDNNRTGSKKVCQAYSQNREMNVLIIGLSVGGGVVVIIIIIATIFLVRRCNTGRRHDDSDVKFQTQWDQEDIIRMDDIPSASTAGTNAHNNIDSNGTPTTETSSKTMKENDLKIYDEVNIGTIPIKGTSKSNTTEKDLQTYTTVDMRKIPTKGTSKSNPAEKDLQPYDTVDMRKIPTKGDSKSKPTEQNLQAYDTVDMRNIPTKGTSKNNPVEKDLQPYDTVDMRKIPTKGTSSSKPSEQNLQSYDTVEMRKIPTKGTSSSKPTEQNLQSYDKVNMRKIPTKGTNSSKPIEKDQAAGAEQQTEKLYDDAQVGAPKHCSDADSDSGGYGPA